MGLIQITYDCYFIYLKLDNRANDGIDHVIKRIITVRKIHIRVPIYAYHSDINETVNTCTPNVFLLGVAPHSHQANLNKYPPYARNTLSF